MVAGDALEPTQTATTVRVRNDETLTTDGPFAETKEQLGGYYMSRLARWTRRSAGPRSSPARATAPSRFGR